MSYFPIKIEITEGVDKGNTQIIHRQEDMPKGVSFKVLETNVKPPLPTPREKFLSGWSGKDLLAKHSLTEYGVWKIRGEDPNCDFGGHHHMPHLDTVMGTLSDAVDHAVSLPSFFQWGSGGDITLTKITKLGEHK